MAEEQTPELQGYCPVAYHAVGKAVEGNAEFSSVYDGKLYHFVNADVKQQFDDDPEKYLPAYGGQCAFGMSIEKDFDPDPTNFKIIDGRLHLFLKNDDTNALALWNKEDESKCQTNADKNWAAKTDD